MTWILNGDDTVPNGIDVKTFSLTPEFGFKRDYVRIGEYEIGIIDFFSMVMYVMNNSDLYPEDPRKKFRDCVLQSEIGEGHNGKKSKCIKFNTNLMTEAELVKYKSSVKKYCERKLKSFLKKIPNRQ